MGLMLSLAALSATKVFVFKKYKAGMAREWLEYEGIYLLLLLHSVRQRDYEA
jgi:hypothetical protein